MNIKNNVLEMRFFVCPPPIYSPVKSRGLKEWYLYKWIRKNRIKEFDLEDYFLKFPKQVERRRFVERQVSHLIDKDILRQLDNSTFKVLRVPVFKSVRKENGEGNV